MGGVAWGLVEPEEQEQSVPAVGNDVSPDSDRNHRGPAAEDGGGKKAGARARKRRKEGPKIGVLRRLRQAGRRRQGRP